MVLLLYAYILSRTSLDEGEFLVEDPDGDRMIIEVASELEAVEELVELHGKGEVRWIGGLIETYDNEFGFRFTPESIVVAEYTAEGLQAVFFETIGKNLTYWQGLGHVYIEGRVIRVPS